MPKRRQLRTASIFLLTVLISAFIGQRALRPLWRPWRLPGMTRNSLAETLEAIGPAARERLAPHFHEAAVAYPPEELALLGFKEERRLEVWAYQGEAWQLIRRYPVVGMSGTLGPKLEEGDRQVPEGLYRVDGLNPNSRYHLSIRLDYPNAFDREQAQHEGRSNLGGDIFIHGGSESAGCLAVGNEAIGELFVMVADTGIEFVRVILAPRDLRRSGVDPPAEDLPWAETLYADIADGLDAFPLPEENR